MVDEGLTPEVLALLACPVCHGALHTDGSQIQCAQCGRRYPMENGIPILLADRAQTGAAD